MDKKIIKLAVKKLSQFQKKYNKFTNVIVDDWRGFRFVYDTQDVRNCNNNCQNCDLYKLLKNEQNGLFSAGLYQASAEDKKLFGNQNFLNCKTIKQYQDCYINFLIKAANTKESVKKELDLIRHVWIIYSKDGDEIKKTKRFKQTIIKKVMLLSPNKKKKIIKSYWRD